jgi:alanine-alpha-ketoisovalerate/valine-pyruvate aminotransferase
LESLWDNKSYVDCFAYFTGPVYAYLLDETELNWRNQLGAKDDISILVQSAYNISLPADIYMEAEERAVLYCGASILGEELDREFVLK